MARRKPKILFEINVQVQTWNRPHVELRRSVFDNDTIRTLIECALKEQPIIIQPVFSSKIKSVSSLIDSGIMSYDPESGEYEYNI